MDSWAYERRFEFDFSRPGKPTDANVESFNGRLRQECMNACWFMVLNDARGKIAAYKRRCDNGTDPLRVRQGHPHRICPPLLAAANNGDVKGAGNLYFRAVLNPVQGAASALAADLLDQPVGAAERRDQAMHQRRWDLPRLRVDPAGGGRDDARTERRVEPEPELLSE